MPLVDDSSHSGIIGDALNGSLKFGKSLLGTELPALGGGPDVVSSTEGYARRFAGATGSWFLAIQSRATLQMLKPWPGGTVLDVGGGHAQLAFPLVENGFQVTVHGSAPSCAARLLPLLDASKCRFVVGSHERLPFPDRSFDAVISFRLMTHVHDWRPLVAEMARVARHAIILDFATTRSLNFLYPLLFNLKRTLEGNTRPFALFNEAEVTAEFGRHDFRKADRYAQFFLPMVVHRALGSRPLSAALEKPFRWTGLTGLFGSPIILKVVRR